MVQEALNWMEKPTISRGSETDNQPSPFKLKQGGYIISLSEISCEGDYI